MRATTLWSVTATLGLMLTGTHASAQEVFGSKFTHQLTPPEYCTNNKGVMCSWVLKQAQGNAGHEKAPRDGTIAQIRLVACAPGGTFVLQIVKVRKGSNVIVLQTGPVINYQGTKRNCTASSKFDVEKFPVDVPVKKGDSLAVIGTQIRFLYNASSGPSILFNPPLAEGDAARTTNLASGFLMLQAKLARP